MDLRRLRLFLAVVDHGGFTRAAEAEFVSQPSVSQAMRELESELGTPLFHRVGRGVRLTSAGEALVSPARQVLRDVDAGAAAVAAVRGLLTGRLDLCTLATLAVDPLAPVIGAFRTAHPGVVLSLSDPEDAAAVVRMVSGGECELGLTVDPDDTLLVHALGRQDLLAVFPPGTPLPAGAIAVTRLATSPLVTSPPGTSTRVLLEEACAGAGVTPHIVVVTEQREAILPMVLAGAGATILPRPLAETAATLGAAVAPLRPRVSREVSFVRRDAPLSPAAAAFLAVAGVADT
jgi:DNA-binding transcriptional LysR family regulator